MEKKVCCPTSVFTKVTGKMLNFPLFVTVAFSVNGRNDHMKSTSKVLWT